MCVLYVRVCLKAIGVHAHIMMCEYIVHTYSWQVSSKIDSLLLFVNKNKMHA